MIMFRFILRLGIVSLLKVLVKQIQFTTKPSFDDVKSQILQKKVITFQNHSKQFTKIGYAQTLITKNFRMYIK